MATGLYISVPFCRTKCSFCNFASGVFSRTMFEQYVEHVCAELAQAEEIAERAGGVLDRSVDSIYLGGGTPSVLAPEQLERIFDGVRRHFAVAPNAEVTVEIAPGTLNPELLTAVVACGVNRASLGVQSFVDKESSSVGRLHTREIALADIERLRDVGISNISLDLIAGLPYQSAESWAYSLEQTIATGVPHVSVYMLEVDEDSRLGRELIAGGTKYHAHHVPDDDLTADLYETAVATLNAAGIAQYEISNFAREGFESKHNLKYWTRQPYLGIGVDAHSMLPALDGAVRFQTADTLDKLLAGEPRTVTRVGREQAIEEEFFLGLRLNRGVQLARIDGSGKYRDAIEEVCEEGLALVEDGWLRLTERGRLLSNEVFGRFVGEDPSAAKAAPKSAALRHD